MSESYGMLLGAVGTFAGLAGLAFVLLAAREERQAVGRSLAAVAGSAHGTRTPVLPFSQRVALPALGRFTQLGKRLSPASGHARLVRQLDLAGNPSTWTLERVLAMKALGAVAAVPAGYLFFSGGGALRAVLLTAVMAVGAFLLPDLLVYNAGTKRQAQI